MNRSSYPYKNRSLIDMQDEKWNDIPGFDGEYQVSSLGRIKSLRRWRNAGRGGYYTKENIRSVIDRKFLNKHLKQHTYGLGITLKKSGKSRTTSISRYVYYVFVKTFDIDNKALVISYKDGNGYNLNYKNLCLTNRSELTKQSIKRGRHETVFQKSKKAVIQLNKYKKEVARFSSITEAAAKTGIHLSGIEQAASGDLHQYKGYFWQYVGSKKAHDPRSAKTINNTYLWKKLDITGTLKKNIFPIINLNLKSLPGERWKDIENLEGKYRISSLGRVRSLSRINEGKKLFQWEEEKILRLFTDGKGDRLPSCILTTLSNGKKKYQQSVARLVYYHFVEKFDLSSRSIRIGYKDGNFANLYYRNLRIKKA